MPEAKKTVVGICSTCKKGVLVVAEVRKRPYSRLLRCTDADCKAEEWRATTLPAPTKA